MTGTDIVKVDSFAALAPSERMQKVLDENLGGGGTFALSRIAVPTSGGVAWAIPGASGIESVPVLRAIILHHHQCRAYWQGEFSGSEPPDCSSDDGVRGVGSPGGACAQCPFSQWESSTKGDGKGQACKAQHRLYTQREKAAFPFILTLPPTSLRNWDVYRVQLSDLVVPYYLAVTDIGLVPHPTPVLHSRVTFKMVSDLGDEAEPAVLAQKARLTPYLDRPVEHGGGDEDGVNL